MKDMLGNYDFDEIYQNYPKKIGKKKGLATCKSQVGSDKKYNELKRAVENYKKFVQGKELAYVKQFDTFMNCWTDWVDYKPESVSVVSSSTTTPRKPSGFCDKCENHGLISGTLRGSNYAFRCNCEFGLVYMSNKIPLYTAYREEATFLFSKAGPFVRCPPEVVNQLRTGRYLSRVVDKAGEQNKAPTSRQDHQETHGRNALPNDLRPSNELQKEHLVNENKSLQGAGSKAKPKITMDGLDGWEKIVI